MNNIFDTIRNLKLRELVVFYLALFVLYIILPLQLHAMQRVISIALLAILALIFINRLLVFTRR